MSSDVQEWIDRGRQQFSEGQFVEALRSFEQALATAPYRADAWNGKAVALRNLGQIEAAQTALEQALDLEPTLSRAWYNKGVLLEENLNRPTEAAECYRRAFELQPDFAEAHRRYQALIQALPSPASVEVLPSSSSTPPTSPEAHQWFQQGVQQYQAGDLLGAIASWDLALEINPDDYKVWNNRGVALSASGRKEEAIESYEKALTIKPDYYEACNNHGVELSGLGRKEDAIESYEKALVIKPDYYEAWNNLGLVLSDLGRKEEAIESYEKAVAIKPDLYVAWYNLGLVLSDLGRKEQAIAKYEKAVEISPDSHVAWYNLGLVLSDLGRKEEAITKYERAVEIKLDFHAAWYNLGLALSDLGWQEEAIASYKKALDSKSDKAEAWNSLGIALSDLGRKEEAIASYKKALEIKSDYHEAWNNLGVALFNLGWKEEAIASYDKALSLKSYYWQAWANRGSAAGSSLQYQTSVRWTLPEVLQNPALDQRGYAGQLACYTEGLRYVERQKQPEGWGQLHRVTGRAHYFHHRFAMHQGAMVRDAVREYHRALEVLTPEAFPEAHLETLQDLIRAELWLGRTDAVRQWQLQGVAVLQGLLNQSPTQKKRQLEFQFHSFRQMSVDRLVQEGERALALQEAERDKNRCLNWMLSAWEEPPWSPAVAQMQGMLDASTAVVYWHLSPDALTTFVLRVDVPEPWVLPDGEPTPERLPASRRQRRDLETWIQQWNQDYEAYRLQGKEVRAEERKLHPWRRQLSQRLGRLREILRIPELEAHLHGISRLVLVPHQDLHRFPLHTLFDQPLTVSYLPSLQVGLSQQAHQGLMPISAQSRLLNLEAPAHNDLEPLAFSQIESALIAQLFQQTTRLAPSQAHMGAVEAALAQPHALLHFTGHGAYNARQPHRSALSLTGTDELTAEAIQALDLSGYSLVCLASCETAATGLPMLEVEYVGLSSAFLRAGAAQVVSSLWLVDEESSAYCMLYFYERLLSSGQPTPAEALQAAQAWLRQITYPELAQWLQQVAQRLGHKEPERMAKAIQLDQDRMNATEPPFADPYYWATFMLAGNLTP